MTSTRALTPGGWPQRAPLKVRLDGEAELAASLLAQRLLLLAILLALLLALLHKVWMELCPPFRYYSI